MRVMGSHAISTTSVSVPPEVPSVCSRVVVIGCPSFGFARLVRRRFAVRSVVSLTTEAGSR